MTNKQILKQLDELPDKYYRKVKNRLDSKICEIKGHKWNEISGNKTECLRCSAFEIT